MTTTEKAAATQLTREDLLEVALADSRLARLQEQAARIAAETTIAGLQLEQVKRNLELAYQLGGGDNIDLVTGAITRAPAPTPKLAAVPATAAPTEPAAS